jgi:tetratricopeptide (TPR) repeat protein
VLSIWVLASTRRRGFRLDIGLLWALGTFFLPFVILPFYLILLIFRRQTKPNRRSTAEDKLASNAESQAPRIRYVFLLPFFYSVMLLGATGVYLYRDYNSVDGHLARAVQAKLSNRPAKTIREYRAAVSLEENPHTHKLLGLELAEGGQWAEALKEFRLAEKGGEPDESLPFRIAQVLNEKGDHDQSMIEYQRFLNSHACKQEPPDDRCETALKVFSQKGR